MTHRCYRSSLITLVAGLALLSSLGCGRPLTTVALEPMTFEHKAAPIEGTIELCLSPTLRRRQWNVEEHPFKIDLGSRTALNVEILAKSAFRNVIVSFDQACGSMTDHAWLSVVILAANRDWDTLWAREQTTTITMQFELAESRERSIWSTTTKGDVTTSTSALFQRRKRAAEAFGQAIEIALQKAFEEIIESEEIRRALGDISLDALPEATAEAS